MRQLANPFTLLSAGSALLMFLIYVLKDDANLGAGPLTPLGLFFIIFGIGACWGWQTGYAINLARDFGRNIIAVCTHIAYNLYRSTADVVCAWIRATCMGGWKLLLLGMFAISCPSHTEFI